MPQLSTTYSERSKEEDECVKEVKKHKQAYKSHLGIHLGCRRTRSSAYCRMRSVLCKIELLLIKIDFTYKNTADVLQKSYLKCYSPSLFYTFRNRHLRYTMNSAKDCFLFIKTRIVVPSSAN